MLTVPQQKRAYSVLHLQAWTYIQVHAQRLLPSAVPWISEDRLFHSDFCFKLVAEQWIAITAFVSIIYFASFTNLFLIGTASVLFKVVPMENSTSVKEAGIKVIVAKTGSYNQLFGCWGEE